MQSFYFFAPPTRSERISSLCVGSRPASSLPSARMAEERPWDPWKQSMWVCGGTTTAGEAANVWAWDGQVILTQRGTAREPKPTREAIFHRQPDIANDQGDARPRTVGVLQNVDAQTPSCGLSLATSDRRACERAGRRGLRAERQTVRDRRLVGRIWCSLLSRLYQQALPASCRPRERGAYTGACRAQLSDAFYAVRVLATATSVPAAREDAVAQRKSEHEHTTRWRCMLRLRRPGGLWHSDGAWRV